MNVEHIDADVIIHYGRACLSKTTRLPVLYVFGIEPIDTSDLLDKFSKQFKKEDHLLILYDVSYLHSIPLIKQKLNELGYNK
jgi:diphthamide biosynthesis protein 2